ncbi:MAG TPA: NAD(P)-dependent alcohol dehydrogenase [Candidatus Acidoferrales bacterium]|jgi:NADPH:quinone reductase-like Zn-dependent oxidoreductase|nr:NAD(P)-dependent alcohol dehydrogenase [Candidatus Acidoferrales bacterium]
MRAIVYSNYGSPDVLRCEEIDKPAPKDNEVLIKVLAASLNPADLHFMRGTPFLLRLAAGLRKPKNTRLGLDLAGQVEAVGRNVTQFKSGDEVFGACRGALAEYVCAAEDKLALKPANISFEDAAAVPVAALTALQGLRDKGRIRPGQKVLVDGASGGVGTFAIQIAKSFGADVTAACSTGKMDTAQSLGADHVIDYTREDFTKSGQRYDTIFAANAYHSIFDYRRALSPKGIVVMAGGGMAQVFQIMSLGPLLSLFGGWKFYLFIAKMNRKDLDSLRDLLATGKVTPLIDNRYPLSEVAEAVRYLEEGHARGKIAITVEHGSGA